MLRWPPELRFSRCKPRAGSDGDMDFAHTGLGATCVPPGLDYGTTED